MVKKSDPSLLFEPFLQRYGKYILVSVVGLYLASLFICFFVVRTSANWIIVFGSLWLGILIGLMVGFFAQEADEWDRKALSASVGAVAGSGILLLLRYLVSTPEIWFYPMGLTGGFIIGTIWERAEPR